MTTAELSPAQKAWQTRKAIAAERERIAILKAGVAAPSLLADCKFISLYVDDTAVGCGFRQFVPMEIGATWVSLFYPPRCRTIRVDRLTFDAHAKPVGRRLWSKTRLVDIIKRAAALRPKDAEVEYHLAQARATAAIEVLNRA